MGRLAVDLHVFSNAGLSYEESACCSSRQSVIASLCCDGRPLACRSGNRLLHHCGLLKCLSLRCDGRPLACPSGNRRMHHWGLLVTEWFRPTEAAAC